MYSRCMYKALPSSRDFIKPPSEMLRNFLDNNSKTKREKHQRYFRKQNKIFAVFLGYFITPVSTNKIRKLHFLQQTQDCKSFRRFLTLRRTFLVMEPFLELSRACERL